MKKLVIILLLLASPAAAATYYADPSGSGTDCSSGTPCTLEYAVETKASSGDTVTCANGTYTLTTSLDVDPGISITATNQDATCGDENGTCNVTIEPGANLGTSDPLIHYYSASYNTSGNQSLSYVELDGRPGSYTAATGIHVENRDDVQITHCNIKNFYGSNGSYGVLARSTAFGYSSIWYPDPPEDCPITTEGLWPCDVGEPGDDSAFSSSWPSSPLSGFELDNSWIYYCGNGPRGLSGGGGYTAGFRPYNVKDSSFHHNVIDSEDSHGPPIYSTNAYLWNFDFYDNTIVFPYAPAESTPPGCTANGDGTCLDDSDSQYSIELWQLRDCEFYNNTTDAPWSLPYAKSSKIYSNTFDFDNILKSGLMLEITNNSYTDAYDNYFQDGNYISTGTSHGVSQNSDYTFHDVTIRNNVFYNIRYRAIYATGVCCNAAGVTRTATMNGLNIYNNTIDLNNENDYLRGIIIEQENENDGTGVLTNVNIKNNIITNSQGHAGRTVGSPTNVSIDYNLFYGNDTNDWLDGTDTNSVTTDPNFQATGNRDDIDNTGYYSLESPSDAIDGGTNVGLSYNGDAPDIGAIESGEPPPPPPQQGVGSFSYDAGGSIIKHSKSGVVIKAQ